MSSAVDSPFNMGNGTVHFLLQIMLQFKELVEHLYEKLDFWRCRQLPIRPFTSFSQRVVEASNHLGPFAIRIGDAESVGDGRIMENQKITIPISFREQRWYTQNDGFTGYPSKAEWWQGCLKIRC